MVNTTVSLSSSMSSSVMVRGIVALGALAITSMVYMPLPGAVSVRTFWLKSSPIAEPLTLSLRVKPEWVPGDMVICTSWEPTLSGGLKVDWAKDTVGSITMAASLVTSRV